MKAGLFFVLFFVAYSHATYSWVNTGILCQTTEPANPGTGWSFCPVQGFWAYKDCMHLSLYNDIVGYPMKCSTGHVFSYTNNQKREESEQEVLDRTTYTICSVSGSDKKVCCYSPGTCHSNTDYTKVCY